MRSRPVILSFVGAGFLLFFWGFALAFGSTFLFDDYFVQLPKREQMVYLAGVPFGFSAAFALLLGWCIWWLPYALSPRGSLVRQILFIFSLLVALLLTASMGIAVVPAAFKSTGHLLFGLGCLGAFIAEAALLLRRVSDAFRRRREN